MECPICFDKKTKFKVLSCSHFFCANCLSDLALGKDVGVAKKGDLKASSSSKPLVTDKVDKNVIECPKCRQVTNLLENWVAGLKSKFMGKLTCRNCDLKKSVEEFRWCHTCLTSVCSACFIDKHMTKLSDGTISLHSASKWEEYNGIIYCLSQMKLQYNKAEMAVKTSKQQIEVYTEGLKDYLKTEIEGKCLSASETVREKCNVIAEAYGVNLESIQTADEEMTLEYILAEVCNLAGLDQKTATLDEVVQLMIQDVPYKEIAKHAFSPKKLEFDPQWPKVDRFRHNSKRSFIIGENIIKKPSDICLLDNNRLLIADPEVGLFLFKQNCLFQAALTLEYSGFSKICNFPAKSLSKTVTVAAFDLKAWCFGLIELEEDGQAKLVSIEGTSLWDMPFTKNELSVASSQSHIFAFDQVSLWSLMDIANPNQWIPIRSNFATQSQNPQSLVVNEKLDSTELFLFNKTWGAIDIITVLNTDLSVWNVKRVELPFVVDKSMYYPIFAPTPDFDVVIIGYGAPAKKLYLWFPGARDEQFQELCEFRQKIAQKMVINNNAAFMIVNPEKDSKTTSLEMIAL